MEWMDHCQHQLYPPCSQCMTSHEWLHTDQRSIENRLWMHRGQCLQCLHHSHCRVLFQHSSSLYPRCTRHMSLLTTTYHQRSWAALLAPRSPHCIQACTRLSVEQPKCTCLLSQIEVQQVARNQPTRVAVAAAVMLLRDRWLQSTGSCSQNTEPCSHPSSRRTESPLRLVRSVGMGSMCRLPCRTRSDHPSSSSRCPHSRRPRTLPCTGTDRHHRLLLHTGRRSGTGSWRSPPRQGRGAEVAMEEALEVAAEVAQQLPAGRTHR
jgi:hypothetical protein